MHWPILVMAVVMIALIPQACMGSKRAHQAPTASAPPLSSPRLAVLGGQCVNRVQHSGCSVNGGVRKGSVSHTWARCLIQAESVSDIRVRNRCLTIVLFHGL
jgi:hypothetical protein